MPVASGWGAAAAGLLVGLYAAVVGGASRLDHLAGQTRADWYLLVPIVVGFGVQVALMAELRQQRRQARLAAAATDGVPAPQPLACWPAAPIMLRRYVRSEDVIEEPDIAEREARALELVAALDLGVGVATPRLLAVDPTVARADVPRC